MSQLLPIGANSQRHTTYKPPTSWSRTAKAVKQLKSNALNWRRIVCNFLSLIGLPIGLQITDTQQQAGLAFERWQLECPTRLLLELRLATRREMETWNREELCAEVWAQPLTKLASKYGISAVALSKVCDKLQISPAGRGYWVKKGIRQAGRTVAITGGPMSSTASSFLNLNDPFVQDRGRYPRCQPIRLLLSGNSNC